MGCKHKPIQAGEENEAWRSDSSAVYLHDRFREKNTHHCGTRSFDYHNNIVTNKLYEEMGHMILQLGGTGEYIFISLMPFLHSSILHGGHCCSLTYLFFFPVVSHVMSEAKRIWKSTRDGFRHKWKTAQGVSGASASDVHIKHPYATELTFLIKALWRCEWVQHGTFISCHLFICVFWMLCTWPLNNWRTHHYLYTLGWSR